MASKHLSKRKEELRSQGFSIMLYRPDSVTLRKRPSTNIWLAILLTSITGGLWLIFWAVKYFRETELVVLKENKDGSLEESYQIGKVSVYGTPEKHEAPKTKTSLLVPIVISAIFGTVIVSGIVNGVQTATLEALEAERLEQEILNDWTHPQNLPSLNPSVVPWLVGKDASLVVEAFFDKFDFYLTEVSNLDTDETISQPIASYNADDEYYSGYFVCGQSLPPGSNHEGWKDSYDFSISISKNCARNQPEFVMGEAATLAGRWMPLSVAGASAMSEVKTVDGVFVQFIDEEYGSPKRMLIQTGFGYSEIELAWIDIASDWCQFENSDPLFEQNAISVRNELFPANQNIRLVQPDGLSGDEWFVHRLDTGGNPIDGELPTKSTNEILVSTGYWVPDEYEIDLDNKNRAKDISARKWKVRDPDNVEPELLVYAKLLARAGSAAISEPNADLAVCVDALQEEVDEYNAGVAAARKAEEERNRLLIIKKKKQKEKQKNQGSGNGSSGGSGSSDSSYGSNCTYVGGYYRGGSYVRGHLRCYNR